MGKHSLYAIFLFFALLPQGIGAKTLAGEDRFAIVVGIGEYPPESGWNRIHGDMDVGFDISVAELAMTSRGDSHADEIISAMEADDISGARNLITAFRSMPEPVFDLSGEAGQYRFELYKAECQLVDYLDAVLLMREGRPLKARKALRTVAASGGYYASAAEEVLDRLR